MRTYFGEETGAVLPPAQRNKVAETGTLTMMFAAGALMIVEMSVHQILLGGFMILAAIIIALPKESQLLLTNFEKLQRKHGVNLYGILFSILTIICFLDFATSPASAQFFNNAQTWMNQSFGTAAGNNQTTEVIDLVFNLLRGLFLIYVGIALVQIVQAARNDEDWKTLARTPLIIVLAVFVGDLVTGLLVGV
ncbi:hypothetical protein [Nodularia sp. NIES-3585]|uniref:hypothetical protein n=1 Tax=Nodularia sp. NIES-3585 TaxID=1973477 RepID=UPI000B5C68B2|nr:hypothetical protein [Nodularia sp. NIES-3585]GAX38805.1 hypothetical protein NIES3585_48570 [Nodularia sp. NIES-3585]